MLAWLRSWRGGTVVAAACLVVALVRVIGAPLDWLTVVSFPLAAGYGLAAVLDRRAENARRPAARPDPTLWTADRTRIGAWLAAERGTALHPGVPASPVAVTVATSTKDRVGALIAIAAAVVGLVLVFHDREVEDHSTPTAPTSATFSELSAPPPGSAG
jgi:hypothetical protein